MGIDMRVFANTTLSTEEIFEILCKDMDVKIDETHPEKIVGEDFSCLVFHIEPEGIISDYLAKPLNLHFEYRISGWGIAGYVSFMRLLLNWFKHTDADTIFTYKMNISCFRELTGGLSETPIPSLRFLAKCWLSLTSRMTRLTWDSGQQRIALDSFRHRMRRN